MDSNRWSNNSLIPISKYDFRDLKERYRKKERDRDGVIEPRRQAILRRERWGQHRKKRISDRQSLSARWMEAICTNRNKRERAITLFITITVISRRGKG